MPKKADRVELTDITVKNAKAAPPGKRNYLWDSKVSGFGLRITDKGAKAFIFMCRISGEQWLETLGQYDDLSLKDARKQASILVGRIANGENPAAEAKAAKAMAKAPPAPPPSVYTVTKAVAAYEKTHISKMKPRSQVEARRPLEKILLARWPDRALVDVTKADIREALADIVEAGSPVAANRSLANLKAFFGWCVSEDRLTVNPCIGIRPPGGDESSRDRVLSDDEIRLLWPQMEETDYPFGFLAQFLLVTAQRRDEAANMRWSEISDLDGPTPVWTIPASKNKGGRLHEVPLTPLAVGILKSLPRIAAEFPVGKSPVMSDWVFTTNGKAPISGFSGGKERLDELTVKEIARIAKETGTAPATLIRWTPHDLRRTAASGMAHAGIPPHVVSRVLNHSPGKAEGITAIYNRHGYGAEKRHALGLWAKHLGGIVNPAKLPESNVVDIAAARG